ncbi:MAG: histidine kinase dimerization/phosphoacceptor domain -containing protein, partial [Leptolyngbyaceae cyanobacterium bins.59]|nr:histidine kinase dimerization/phosphoacceptor domain -containing protein [Leptolyngbyaceae cyanobacterium bins.59]
LHPSPPLEESNQIPLPIVQWVVRKQETIVLGNASEETPFANDPYFQSNCPKSILCMPIRGHGKLIGILYLENNLIFNAFTPDRAMILQVLTSQAAIALENAQLYEALEHYSQNLEAQNRQLEQEVSDRRRAEEGLKLSLAEREILLKEIHHRVKNNLQIVSGLLQLQAQSSTDPTMINILRESQHRIESMSLIHKKLYFSAELGHLNLADYIPSLATSLLMSYQMVPNSVELDMDIDPIILNIDQAIPCGLIINELISNALKYAFPNGRLGMIHLHLHSLPDRQVELLIQDNGVGLPESVSWDYTQSLGLSLVKDLALEQLEGTFTVTREGGTAFYIQFPHVPVEARLPISE